jgi:hypothetical protein
MRVIFDAKVARIQAPDRQRSPFLFVQRHGPTPTNIPYMEGEADIFREGQRVPARKIREAARFANAFRFVAI